MNKINVKTLISNKIEEENVKQESPPAWTQEAYCPPCSEYSFCCPTRVPPPGGGGSGYPPGGGYLTGYPPGGTRTPPGGPGTPRGGYLTGYPPGGGTWPGYPPAASWHSGKCCKALWDMGTPPPCGQTDWWMDRRVSKHYLPSYYVRGR